jgi:hypothetical protein
MPNPQEIRREMLRLAQALLQKTRQGEIQWTATDRENQFLFSSAMSGMLIEGSFGNYDDEDTGDFTLELLNHGGSVAARLEIGLDEAEISEDLSQGYQVLERLYLEAQNRALEINSTLDDMRRTLGIEPGSDPVLHNG